MLVDDRRVLTDPLIEHDSCVVSVAGITLALRFDRSSREERSHI
jgi:hypothetical protein